MKMRLMFFSGFLLSFLVLSSFSSRTLLIGNSQHIISTPSPKKHTFTNDNPVFSFEYTEINWILTNADQFDDALTYVTLSTRESDEIMTIAVLANPTKKSAYEWALGDLFIYNTENLEIQRNQETIISGRESIIITHPRTCDTAAFMRVIFTADDIAFEISYLAPNNSVHFPDFKELLASFQISDMPAINNTVPALVLPSPIITNCGTLNTRITSAATQCPGAPFMIPAEGYVMSSWGCWGGTWCSVYSQSDPHKGIDIGPVGSNLWGNGTPGVLDIYAPAYGVVTMKTVQSVVLRHSDHNVDAYFAHMANNATGASYVFVNYGQVVNAGNVIGKMGNYGAYETHLHYNIMRVGGSDLTWSDSKDPTPFLRAQGLVFSSGWQRQPMICLNPITPPPSTDCLKPLLRYWNENLTGHFYTSRWEDLGPGQSGWVYERSEGYVAAKQDCFAPNTLPLYRFWHPDRQKHFYTTSESEKAIVEQQGFVYEGITGYVLREANSLYHTLPLYRCYSSQLDNHFYTTSWSEVQSAVNNYGYIYERVEAYVFGAEALNLNPSKVYLPLVMLE